MNPCFVDLCIARALSYPDPATGKHTRVYCAVYRANDVCVHHVDELAERKLQCPGEWALSE